MDKPIIAIDIREATTANRAGKAVYNLELTKCLIQNEDYIWWLFSDNKAQTEFQSSANVKVITIDQKGLLWHWKVKNYLQANPVQTYVAMTSFITPYFLKSLNIKLVISIHDLICFLYPEGHPLKAKLIETFFLPKIINRVNSICCVSPNTASDLQRIFPDLDSSKIKIASCGFTPANNQVSAPNTKNYLLSVSTLLPRKNFETLINAFNTIKNEYSGELIIIGAPADSKYKKKLMDLITSLNLTERIKFNGFVTSEELQNYYRNADIFIYPSLYEGFGIPLLEAMNNNCPVICSNSSSLPSVARHAALYFDPLDSTKLAANILQLLNEPELKQQLINAGQLQVQEFSWQKTAEEVLKVL